MLSLYLKKIKLKGTTVYGVRTVLAMPEGNDAQKANRNEDMDAFKK